MSKLKKPEKMPLKQDSTVVTALPNWQALVQQHYPAAMGVMLTGSALDQDLGPHSDIDLLIFYAHGERLTRSIFKVEDRVVECLTFSLQEIEGQLEQERRQGKSALIGMLARAQVLKETPQKHLEKVQQKAQSQWQQKAPALSATALDFKRHKLSKLVYDLRDEQDPTAAFTLVAELLPMLTQLVLRPAGHLAGESLKWDMRALQQHMPEQHQALSTALQQLYSQQNTAPLLQTIDQLLEPVGGLLMEGYRFGLHPEQFAPGMFMVATLHFHDFEAAHELLAKVVPNMIKVAKERGKVPLMFYSTGHAQGLHINWYIQADPLSFYTGIKPLLENILYPYLAARPSLLAEPAWYQEYVPALRALPDNHIYTWLQQPRTGTMVGGSTYTLLCQLMQDLNKAAHAWWLAQEKVPAHKEHVYVAGTFMLMAAQACGIKNQHINTFFEQYAQQWGTAERDQDWGPFLLGHDHFEANPNVPMPRKDFVFEAGFTDSLHEAVLNAKRQRGLKEAKEAIRKAAAKLKAAHQTNDLYALKQDFNGFNTGKYPLWPYYKELVHAFVNMMALPYGFETKVAQALSKIKMPA